ncbi:MAG: hypothetical protein NTV70_01405, partial [Acidobacteria bacterium]|nr:hypothetical protein [Acidobacteriota bacterium]
MKLAAFFLAVSLYGGIPTYGVRGSADGWAKLFEVQGFARNDASPDLLVLRPDAPVPEDLKERIAAGLIVVVEANRDAAESLGIGVRQGGLTRRELDTRSPEQTIVWADEVRVLAASLPVEATVYSRDRWTGIPLMASWKSGRGAILWLAAPLPADGYGRFPFILHALSAVGFRSPLESKRTWVFFDYAYRSRTDPEYLARQWRNSGISAVHVAAWYHFDRDPVRDAFLEKLITACHRQAIQVHAWLELPHVSDKFWNEHPEWREKTAQLADAAVYWRKLMNLQRPECLAAVRRGTADLLARFDWDGVNLAELYFESYLGPDDPSQFTPMNDDVRSSFQRRHGFDPATLFRADSPNYWKLNPPALRKFYEFRVELISSMHAEWLGFLAGLRTRSGDLLGLSITTVDDLYDTSIRDFVGYDARQLVRLLDTIPFTYIIQDPGVLWHLGPERYAKMANLYANITPRQDELAIDINVAARHLLAYPTEKQLGTELLQQARISSQSFAQVMFYSESSILRLDRNLLGTTGAIATIAEQGPTTTVDSADGVGLAWTGPANVNGKPWPYQSDTVLWLPAGKFTITPRESKPPLRLIDFNGTIRSVEEVAIGDNTGIAFIYKSVSRSIAVLDQKPGAIWIDGKEAQPTLLTR